MEFFSENVIKTSLPTVWNPIAVHSFIHSFIHSVFCLTTGPKPPPKRCLHIVRSTAFSFKWEYPLLSLRSSSSFLRLLPRLLATSISPFIFPSITCFRRQFLRKMWPIQLAFLFLISCRIFLVFMKVKNFFWRFKNIWINDKCTLIFMLYFFHNILTSMFRPVFRPFAERCSYYKNTTVVNWVNITSL